MAEQKKMKGKPKAASRGSQKDHLALPARQRNPEQMMLRVLRANGLERARAYAEHFGLQAELEKPYFVDATLKLLMKKEARQAGLSASPAPQPQTE